METIFYIWGGIFLIGWSIYQLKSVIQLRKDIMDLSEKAIKLIRRKNKFLGISSIIIIIYIPTILCFLLLDVNDHTWLYLGFIFVLRFLEDIFGILLILTVETSLNNLFKRLILKRTPPVTVNMDRQSHPTDITDKVTI